MLNIQDPVGKSAARVRPAALTVVSMMLEMSMMISLQIEVLFRLYCIHHEVKGARLEATPARRGGGMR